VERLEKAFDRERKATPGEFTQWEKDLAYTAQKTPRRDGPPHRRDVHLDGGDEQPAVAGGVALNCKLNKRLRESDAVDDFFVQPVAHDAGLALGAGMLERPPSDVPEMETVSYGPEYDASEIRSLLRHEQDPLRRAAPNSRSMSPNGWQKAPWSAGSPAVSNSARGRSATGAFWRIRGR